MKETEIINWLPFTAEWTCRGPEFLFLSSFCFLLVCCFYLFGSGDQSQGFQRTKQVLTFLVLSNWGHPRGTVWRFGTPALQVCGSEFKSLGPTNAEYDSISSDIFDPQHEKHFLSGCILARCVKTPKGKSLTNAITEKEKPRQTLCPRTEWTLQRSLENIAAVPVLLIYK